MGNIILILLLLLPLRAWAACDPAVVSTTLPRAGLKMLNHLQCDWHVPIQQTDQILDTNAGFLNIPSTWSAKQILHANPVRLGGLLFDLGTASLTTSDIWTFRLDPYDATVNRIECEAYTGTSFGLKVCAGEDTGACATQLVALTCDNTGAVGTTITNGNVTARSKVTVVITAVSGSVTKGEVYIEGVAR